MLTRLTFLGFVIAVASVSVADEQASGLVFEKDVAPILKVKCIKCHNSKARKAELDLGSFTSLSKGGESGAILDAENPKEGVLYEYIHDGTMPPEDAKPLTSREKETLLQWIRSGAKSQASAAPQVSQHDVIPILNLRCTVCHGLRQKSAGLDLRTKQSMLKGGKSGPAFVPGKPEESLMLKKIHAKDMPPPARLIPDGVRPVDATELKILTQWIAYGAPIIEVAADVATTESDALVTDEDRQFWAFQKPVRPKPPAVKNQTQVRTPVDAFLLKKLEAAGLSYNEQADRMTAIRRVAFDLTGLPPDWKDVERFLADQSNDAHAKIVDRFLASPRYGERWGQYWLDLSGYADSEGKRSADPIRPHAWRYRDYVVRSFNMDKPYDRFLLEQIAGDELVDYENAKEITQPMMDNLVATAFLRMAPDGTGSDIVNTVEERFEVIADELQVFGSAILGLTLECAKCHSHKYDPIPQRDYYRLMATFKGAYDEHDWLKPSFVPGQTKAKKPGRVLTHVTSEVTKKWEADKAAIQRQIYDINTVIAKQREEVRNRLLAEKLKSIPEVIRSDVEQAIRTNDKKRSEVQKYLAKKFSKQLTFDEKALAAADSKYKKAAADAAKKIKELQTDMPKAPQIRALWDRGEPSNTYIYLRGQITTPGRLVGPGVLSVLTDGKTPFTPTAPWPGSNKTGRRLALANWLISKDHPLTARVMVNRIWFHHFGRGIVESLSNFGNTGTGASHPQLLDWLATEFMANGWSIKHMHRVIMNSAAYRQKSGFDESKSRKDPHNALLSRMPLNRLDAEAVRDGLLKAAGRLNLEPFGTPDPVDVQPNGLVTSISTEAGYRRSIYILHRRKEMPTILENFDLPQMNPNCIERPSSTVASQALHLMNNAMVRKLSRDFAKRLEKEAGDDRYRQIERAYQVGLSRMPTETERQLGLETLEQLNIEWNRILKASKSKDELPAKTLALANYCHTLMNSAAFLFVD